MLLTLVMLIAPQAASDLCSELGTKERPGTWAVAPFSCQSDLTDACATVLHTVVECLNAAKLKIVTPGALTAAVDEQALSAVVGAGDTRKLKKLAELMAINYLVVGEVSKQNGGVNGLIRVIGVEDGKILHVARVTASETSAHVKTVVDAGTDPIETGLRRLADKLAQGFSSAPGGARYKRLAVLDLKTSGAAAKERNLGTMIAAELVTRFKRDHNLLLVERSRLDSVINELALGQTGLVDEKLAPKVGQLVEADALVLGDVGALGDRFVINARIVDVLSGVTLVAESVQLKADGLMMMSADALVLRTKSGAVLRSLLIPGWGQLYNKQEQKGYTFIGVAGALAAGSIATGVGGILTQNAYQRAPAGSDFDSIAKRAEALYIARDVLLGALAAVWVYNLVDAYLNGQTFDSAVATKSVSVGIDGMGFSF